MRLVEGPDPLVISKSNEGRPITGKAPEKGFWSTLLTAAESAVDIFDREDREEVEASIRGSGAKEFSAPAISTPQVIIAGVRPLAIGWSSPKVAGIRVVGSSGATVVEGKGAGSLSISPAVDLRPGDYRIEFASAGGGATQALRVIPASAGPKRPVELDNAALPDELRAVATAVWFASLDKKYRLEALQSVAPLAQRSRAARLLTLAIIQGRDISGTR